MNMTRETLIKTAEKLFNELYYAEKEGSKFEGKKIKKFLDIYFTGRCIKSCRSKITQYIRFENIIFVNHNGISEPQLRAVQIAELPHPRYSTLHGSSIEEQMWGITTFIEWLNQYEFEYVSQDEFNSALKRVISRFD